MTKSVFSMLKTGHIIISHSLDEFLEDDETFVYNTCVEFDDSGELVCTGNSKGKALFFDWTASRLIGVYDATYANVKDIALSDGRLAIASSLQDSVLSSKGALDIYRLDTQEKVASMAYNANIKKLEFNPNNDHQLTFIEYEMIKVLNIDTLKIDFTFISGDTITEYIQARDMIAFTSYDGTIRFWIMENGGYEFDRIRIQLNISFLEASQGVLAVSSVYSNKSYILRNMQNSSISRLEGHEESIKDCALSKDHKKLISYPYSKGELLIWDFPEKAMIGRIMADSPIEQKLGQIYHVFSIDPGLSCFLSSQSKTLLLIPYYHTKQLVEESHRQLGGRTLTEQEKTDLFIIR